jgi:uncharacterized protein (DUF983 family)
MIASDGTDHAASSALQPRAPWAAIKRGLRGRCPACGEGRLLHHYLKVNDTCPACGEELHHQRADDFPPYITIFVVGHVLGAALFALDDFYPDLPMAFHLAVWPILCILLSLWLLPIFKGALIGYQWALRMHGFETSHAVPSRECRVIERPARA